MDETTKTDLNELLGMLSEKTASFTKLLVAKASQDELDKIRETMTHLQFEIERYRQMDEQPASSHTDTGMPGTQISSGNYA